MDIRRDVRIPTRDGIELSADLFLPAGASPAAPVPVVLNMDPYRKDDWGASWALALGGYLAEHGYAYCRLDVRGTGSSRGVATDEYAVAETLDGHDAVEWLAAQPWCTGTVGMWGLSYGGFTSIQVAATRPPHLRAIVPIQATDDRYTDDVHYVGGALAVSEMAQYAVSQVASNALPPLPSAWGDAWIEGWRERLEATPVWLFNWTRDQRDGPSWRRGSLAPEWGRLEAAVLHFAGWMDEYVDAALRMQALCVNAAARRTIVGPWVHGLPDGASPAPNIDWRREMIRWFDRFLKDIPNGVDDEPALTWFHRDPTPPERFPKRLNGAWRAAARWPLPAAGSLQMRLGDQALLDQEAVLGPGTDTFAHRPTAGVDGGSLCWGAGHPPNGLAADLRLEDGFGPAYTGDPLDHAVDVFGTPVAVLHLSSQQPIASLVVRLADVAPDGATEQVSEGILNLTHRDSHVGPAPLEPGRTYEVRIALRAAGYRFPAGHRIQLRIASAHWPVIWPSPGANELTIHRGLETPSRLELPLAPSGADAVPAPAFDESPAELEEAGTETSEPVDWSVVRDPETGDATVRTFEASTSTLPDGISSLYVDESLLMSASERVPGDGRFENACEYRLEREGHRVVAIADGVTIAGATSFDMTVGLRVELDGAPFFERAWHEVVPRDLV